MLASTKMTTATLNNSATDLIESKFNLLAGKILDELRQAEYSREFFQALDTILNDQQHHEARQLKRKALVRSTSKHQQERSSNTTTTTATKDTSETHGNDFNELKRQCELITEKQRQQQEQLNNHQQILFDSQYRSLPAEITEAVASHEQRRAHARLQAPTQLSDISQTGTSNKQEPVNRKATTNAKGRTGGVKTSASRENLEATSVKRESPTPNQKQRSAIPQSTILSGINQKVETPAGYPISKSATVGANSSEADNSNPTLKRQSSLRLNRETREIQKESTQQRQQQTRPLAASEKLRQRRPTKASLFDQKALGSDDSDLDEEDDDDDDDDDEFRYQNLASHRAYLNQRFINQQQEQPTKTSGNDGATQAAKQQDAVRQRQVQSTIQSGLKQAPTANPSNMTVAKQRQRFSNGAQVVRSSTMATSRPSMGTTRQQTKSIRGKELEQVAIEHEQPRSLGGLLTSHDIGQLYKPHMNYSTSLLGNHRLSDDDEIIIIPTCQSPSLMSASVSPVPNRNQSQQQAAVAVATNGQQLLDQGNMDESSERFSISRTKSFWEKLANSKSGGGGGGELESTRCNNASSPQQAAVDQRNYFNSSQRSLSSGPNLVVDQSKSSQCSLHNQSGGNHDTSKKSNNGCHYPAAMKSAFDRMDSTGGSGNSHYSGASTSSGGSTSGDEQTLSSSNAGHMSLAERRAMLISAANAKTDLADQKQRSGPNASMNPTINQLVIQDQINRSDKFRQTR